MAKLSGVLVLYPATFYRPSEQQIADLIHLLIDEQIITEKPYGRSSYDDNVWCNGPNFHRLGILTRSQPMTISFATLDPDQFDPDELDEEWEKLTARSSFTISIQDSGPPELAERGDLIWQQIERTPGDALAMTYHHI